MTDAATLAAHLQARVDEQVLRELTNPRNPGATEADSDKLQAAAADAIARFRAATGSPFDISNAVHADAASDLTLGLLLQRAGQAEAAAERLTSAQALLNTLSRRSGLTARTGSAIVPATHPPQQFDFGPDAWSGYASDSVGRTGGTDERDDDD